MKTFEVDEPHPHRLLRPCASSPCQHEDPRPRSKLRAWRSLGVCERLEVLALRNTEGKELSKLKHLNARIGQEACRFAFCDQIERKY